MGAFKSINASDAIVLPYVANKSWVINSNQIPSDDVNIYIGKNVTGSFNPDTDPVTNGEYERLIYATINHYFYHDYPSYIVNTQSLEVTNNYQNISPYIASSSYYEFGNPGGQLVKDFPSGSNATIQVLSISKDIIGSGIKKGSFTYTSNISFSDDGVGNLYHNTNNLVGNIFYEHGLVVITNPLYQNILTGSFSVSFKNEHTIYEKTIKCTILDREFGYSYNPTLQVSGSEGDIKAWATSSSFSPYITTVGMYDEYNNLLAVAKLGQPLPTTSEIDYNIIIKLDW